MPLELIPAKEVERKEVKKKEIKKIPILPVTKRPAAIPLIEAEEIVPTKPGREPTGAKPVIPTGDTCCVGLCTHLNSEIDTLGQAINIRQEELKFLGPGTAKMKTRRQVATLTTKISTLKDLRFTLLDKSICKCVELPRK